MRMDLDLSAPIRHDFNQKMSVIQSKFADQIHEWP